MKRNKRRRARRGGLLMTAGLLLIAAALLLTMHNLREQEQAEAAAFEALGELLEAIPKTEEAEIESSGLVLTDAQGHPLDWPLDAQGEPMPWPVGKDGQPVASLADADGRVHEWAQLRLDAQSAPTGETADSAAQDKTPLETENLPSSPAQDAADGDAQGMTPLETENLPSSPVQDAADDGVQNDAPGGTEPLSPAGEREEAQAEETELDGWTRDAHGALLPWIRDAAGRLTPWPTDSEGMALAWSQLGKLWSSLVDTLLPYLTQAVSLPTFVLYPDMEMPTRSADGQTYIGVVEVPSLELSLPVISEWSYPRLKKAPCRFVGSVYSRDMVICGHNYERHFGRLKDLSIGDEVRFTDAEGNVFYYTVCAMEQLEKKAVEEMITGDWDLTLFTCTKGGLTRVTVRCKLERYTVAQESGE